MCCANRYSPDIPLAMTVPSGSVITYETADLWDGNWPDYSDMPDVDANFAKVTVATTALVLND